MIQRREGLIQPLPLLIAHAGSSPVRQGEAASGTWIVESGRLRASVVDGGGHELWLDVLGPGDLVGERDGGVSAWTVTALGPSRLRATRDAALGPALAVRSERLTVVACQLAWLGVRERVERRLDDLAARFGRPVPEGFLIPIRLSQDDIAALAGTTRESANRAVKALVAQGRLSVQRRGRYVVHPYLRPFRR